MSTEKAYFAGGCFWCITPTFAAIDGVSRVVSGYSGGDEVNPTYEQVKAQQTHHRETLMIEYDPEKVSYERLTKYFIRNVDPFDEGGQYIDRGLSYTLAIYYTLDEQKEIAHRLIDEFAKQMGKEVFIAVEPFKAFYEAEEYHQDYYLKHPKEFEQELIDSGRKKA